jgi:hypothetical protein
MVGWEWKNEKKGKGRVHVEDMDLGDIPRRRINEGVEAEAVPEVDAGAEEVEMRREAEELADSESDY